MAESKLRLSDAPYAYPFGGTETAGVGEVDLDLRKHAHTGRDIAGIENAQAAYDGVISFAGDLGDFGLTIIIAHQQTGKETQYSHLKEIPSNASIGKRVSRGEVLAPIGSTGKSTGPHLHYEENKIGHKGPSKVPETRPTMADPEDVKIRRDPDTREVIGYDVPSSEIVEYAPGKFYTTTKPRFIPKSQITGRADRTPAQEARDLAEAEQALSSARYYESKGMGEQADLAYRYAQLAMQGSQALADRNMKEASLGLQKAIALGEIEGKPTLEAKKTDVEIDIAKRKQELDEIEAKRKENNEKIEQARKDRNEEAVNYYKGEELKLEQQKKEINEALKKEELATSKQNAETAREQVNVAKDAQRLREIESQKGTWAEREANAVARGNMEEARRAARAREALDTERVTIEQRAQKEKEVTTGLNIQEQAFRQEESRRKEAIELSRNPADYLAYSFLSAGQQAPEGTALADVLGRIKETPDALSFIDEYKKNIPGFNRPDMPTNPAFPGAVHPPQDEVTPQPEIRPETAQTGSSLNLGSSGGTTNTQVDPNVTGPTEVNGQILLPPSGQSNSLNLSQTQPQGFRPSSGNGAQKGDTKIVNGKRYVWVHGGSEEGSNWEPEDELPEGYAQQLISERGSRGGSLTVPTGYVNSQGQTNITQPAQMTKAELDLARRSNSPELRKRIEASGSKASPILNFIKKSRIVSEPGSLDFKIEGESKDSKDISRIQPFKERPGLGRSKYLSSANTSLPRQPQTSKQFRLPNVNDISNLITPRVNTALGRGSASLAIKPLGGVRAPSAQMLNSLNPTDTEALAGTLSFIGNRPEDIFAQSKRQGAAGLRL